MQEGKPYGLHGVEEKVQKDVLFFIHSFIHSFIFSIIDGRSRDEDGYEKTIGEGRGEREGEDRYKGEKGGVSGGGGGGGGNEDEGRVMEEAIGELYAFLVTESNMLLNSMYSQTNNHR